MTRTCRNWRTPVHGVAGRQALDLADSKLGVLPSQCLGRRIPDNQILIEEVAAWEHDRNANHTKTDWHFTTANARSTCTRQSD
jgi:hypothetical protein